MCLKRGLALMFILIFRVYECQSSSSSDSSLCDSYLDQDSCIQMTECKWNVNTSDVVCSNKDFGCSSKKDQQVCQAASNYCNYQPAFNGGCSPNRAIDCSKQSYLQCNYQGQRCSWTNADKCENFSDGYNCSSKSEVQCNNSSNYCNSSYKCQSTTDNTLCSFKEKADCILSSTFCSYTISSPQQCIDRSIYCQSLSGEDCVADFQFCSFSQTTPSSCVNMGASTICGNKSLTDCDLASQFCQRVNIPYSCVNKVSTATCASNVNSDSCSSVSSCTWSNDNCIAIIDCSTLAQSDCELPINIGYCNSNLANTICSNKADFGCAAFTSKAQCQQYQNYCQYQPMTGTCSSLQNCQNLTAQQCTNVTNKCQFETEQGSCSLQSNLNCASKVQTDCIATPFCVYQFLGCSDIVGDLCSQLSISQCTSSATFCQIGNTGACSDNSSLNCSSHTAAECSNYEGCVSYPSTQEACLNKIDCKLYSDFECQKQSDYCNYTPLSGQCINATVNATQFGTVLAHYHILFIVFIFFFTFHL